MQDSTDAPSGAFSAIDSAVGYLYQIRMALLVALRRVNPGSDDEFSVYLETLDDVVFESIGTPLDLLQLKHHTNSQANLTDASPDIWKSLRVWIDGRKNGSISKNDRLVLITTQAVADGSLASKLKASNRDENGALAIMRAVAASSTNKTNMVAYTDFQSLDQKDQASLVSSIIIAPSEPDIAKVGNEIRHEVRFTVKKEHVDSFVTRLEGWWFTRCMSHLIGRSKQPILSSSLLAQMDDIREQLVSALPVDDDILDHEVDISAYDEEVFVHQAKLAGVNQRRVIAAVRDYYRAFEQRSRWVRENLILVGDLDKYERTLCEEWDLTFQRALDNIGPEAAEAAQSQMARDIYEWVETSCFPIQRNVNNPSICRGSLHMLANELRVGWHPQFLSRIQQILGDRSVAA